jgi:hypothetical protein
MGLFDIFSGDKAREAAEAKASGYRHGYDDLSNYYGQGRDALTSNYDKAAGVYQPLYDTAMRGYSSFADAFGLNGAEGNKRALAAFYNNPGYDVQLQTGVDAIDRGAAARGTLSSPGLLAAEQKYGNDLASTGWSKFADSLAGFGSQALGAAGGLSSAYTGLGSNLNQNYTGQGQQAYNAQLGIGNANAEGKMADYNASANTWNAIMNAGNLLGSIYGYSTGSKPLGASAGGSLGSVDYGDGIRRPMYT